MGDEIRCQECGGAFLPIDKQTREVNTRCNKCGSIMAPRVQAQIRSCKRFELVRAWGPAFTCRDAGVNSLPYVWQDGLHEAVDAELTALYGPEPGGE